MLQQLGFQAVGGERKLRIVPSPWPSTALPSTTASLLSVASARGLLAAASPDTLVLHDTDTLRGALQKEDGTKVEAVEPRWKTSIPRISHLAFSSDESCLVITAENGGGLAVYDVSALADGAALSPGFEIATEGVSVRHLLPNPGKEYAHVFAVILTDGKLVRANFEQRKLMPTAAGGVVLRDNVSCASWSKLGKQIIAGLADGSAVQLDWSGNEKGVVPRPPRLHEGRDPQEQALPLTGFYWLENQDFLMIHTPVNPPADASDGMPPSNDSIYHLVHRDKDTMACSYHRFSVDPCPAFMDQRLPAHHFIQRIREWQPNLDDTLLLGSTASTDIGVLTRSKTPLSQDVAADQITHTYTTTSFPDTRRAALPTSVEDEMSDTSPIGMVLDMSSKQKVRKPIPNDETLDESSTPLPELCVFNHEGLLSAWWFVYNEGVRQNILAPGLSAETATSVSSQQQQPQPAQSAFESSPSPFGSDVPRPSIDTPPQPAFGQPSTPAAGQSSTPAFGQPSTPAFGKPFAPAFGQTNTPAFGGASAMGNRASPWGSSAGASTAGVAFGKPSFGTPSQPGAGSAFGQVGAMASAKASPWGAPSQAPAVSQTGGATFGQPSGIFGGNASAQSPFSTFGKPSGAENAKPPPSPFAAFAKDKPAASPLASFGSQNNKPSPFAAAGQGKPGMPLEPSFGSTVTLSSNTGSFGSAATLGQAPVWGKPSEPKEQSMGNRETSGEDEKSPAGLAGLSGFKLGSTFKSDGTSQNDLPKPKDPGSSLFGLGFGNALGEVANHEPTSASRIKEEPDDSKGPQLKDIPEAASTPRARPAKQSESAPLPPDFLSAKPIKEDDEPPPPLPQSDAPLPPDFLSTKVEKDEGAEVPIAGSPPVDVGGEQNSSAASAADEEDGPAEDGEQEGFAEEEDEEDEEGGEEEEEEGEEEEDEDGGLESGEVDDGEEEEEADWENEDEDIENRSPVIDDLKRLSAFETRVSPASPKQSRTQEQSTTPETAQKPSFTPAGFPKAPVDFPAPRTVQESPRSPSPVRADRAITSPVRTGAAKPSSPAPAANRISVPPAQQLAPGATLRGSSMAPPPAPVPESLDDEEDARMKQILDAPIEPSTEPPEFIAHQDYNGRPTKPGIAGQIEMVYRDINSMIDTLGLNARALHGFLDGHAAQREPSNRDIDDLDDDKAWRLGEIGALQDLQQAIDKDLESGKIEDVAGKVADLQEEEQEMVRLKVKAADLRKQLAVRADPEQRAAQNMAPLPPETAAQQAELRQGVQHVQKLFSQVEEAMTILRADLASASATSAASSGAAGVPTVEAVTNTILKMTAMIERKSGDIDVLEARIKRLPRGVASLSLGADYEDGLVHSMAGSKLSNGHAAHGTPPAKGTRARMAANGDQLGMSGMFGSRLRTPPSAFGSSMAGRRSVAFEPSASALGRSTASISGGSARKKMADVSVQEVEAWQRKAGRRRQVLAALKDVVEGRSEGQRVIRAQ